MITTDTTLGFSNPSYSPDEFEYVENVCDIVVELAQFPRQGAIPASKLYLKGLKSVIVEFIGKGNERRRVVIDNYQSMDELNRIVEVAIKIRCYSASRVATMARLRWLLCMTKVNPTLEMELRRQLDTFNTITEQSDDTARSDQHELNCIWGAYVYKLYYQNLREFEE